MLKILIGMYILVALKEAIDFKLSGWIGDDALVDWCALLVCSVAWPIIYPVWISIRFFKMLRPSPKQYQMFAKEK